MSLQEANRIAHVFGEFMAKETHVIDDAKLLPMPKHRIEQALIYVEKSLIARAEFYNLQGNKVASDSTWKDVALIRSGLVVLKGFNPIPPEDQARVDYFNSYQKIDQVPESERHECIKLITKHMFSWVTHDPNNGADK